MACQNGHLEIVKELVKCSDVDLNECVSIYLIGINVLCLKYVSIV